MGKQEQEKKKFQVLHQVPSVAARFHGINSEVLHHHYPDGAKKVHMRYGAQKGGFLLREATEAIHDIVEYQSQLTKRSVPMPPIDQIALEYSPTHERAVVAKTSLWVGAELRTVFESADPTRDQRTLAGYISKMMKIIKPICQERRRGWEVEVGIDPRCSNFTVDEKGKMWFVDLFPTRYRKNGKPIIEWPAPKSLQGKKLGYFKHFDVRGILLCMMAQLARAKPELKHYFESIILREAKHSMNKKEYHAFHTGIAETPWRRLSAVLRHGNMKDAARAKAQQIIRGAYRARVFGVSYGIYTLRELALELAQAKFISQNELESFFKQSHFEDALAKEKVLELEAILTGYLERGRRAEEIKTTLV